MKIKKRVVGSEWPKEREALVVSTHKGRNVTRWERWQRRICGQNMRCLHWWFLGGSKVSCVAVEWVPEERWRRSIKMRKSSVEEGRLLDGWSTVLPVPRIMAGFGREKKTEPDFNEGGEWQKQQWQERMRVISLNLMCWKGTGHFHVKAEEWYCLSCFVRDVF